MKAIFIAGLLVGSPVFGLGQGNNNNPYDVGPKRQDYSRSLVQTREALCAFTVLTELLSNHSTPKTSLGRNDINSEQEYSFVIPGQELTELTKNAITDWDIQHIGFPNWIDLLALREQELAVENYRLEIELAKLKKRPEDDIRILEERYAIENEKLNQLMENENSKSE